MGEGVYPSDGIVVSDQGLYPLETFAHAHRPASALDPALASKSWHIKAFIALVVVRGGEPD